MPDTFSARGTPMQTADFDSACTALGVAAPQLSSVLTVETKGFGFFADRRPKLLFERHVFRERTGARFDAAHPDLSNKTPGGYSGGVAEYDRLARAMALDRVAALESASRGLAQIMGYHATGVGYAGVEAMVANFVASESNQLKACARFINSNHTMANALVTQDWETFALHYNGDNYKRNNYDQRLQTNCTAFAAGPLPDLQLRAAQAWLTYLGYDVHGVDGVMGEHTRDALTAVQGEEGLPPNGQLDAGTLAKLQEKDG